jgi:hypothetical protein
MNNVQYVEQTTHDVTKHRPNNKCSRKTPEQVTGVFSVFRLYTLYKVS